MRLILVIPSLASGGAEHVMALLANHWAGCAHQVTLVTMASPDLDRVALHPAVTRVGLGLMHASGSAAQSLRENGARLARLRAALRAARPHAAISFLPSANVLTVAAARTLRVPGPHVPGGRAAETICCALPRVQSPREYHPSGGKSARRIQSFAHSMQS